MYSTCIFCQAALGENEVVERFPVGRRLAFDPAKGRLWVVCRKCERWNLTPIEERREAIEECERWYRDTTRRVATENVGLCRLAEGTELVRIGAPQRPEMAAWRYGDQFGRRRLRSLGLTAGAAVGGGGLWFGAAAFASIGAVSLALQVGVVGYSHYGRTYPVTSLRLPDGQVAPISPLNLVSLLLAPDGDGGWTLSVPHRSPDPKARRFRLDMLTMLGPLQAYRRMFRSDPTVFRGDDALRALSTLLPHVNRMGAGRRRVRDAVALLDRDPTSQALLQRIGTVRPWSHTGPESTLRGIQPEFRLALEMALHETEERRALEGELAVLEERWREAEEIAAISDSLLLPESVSERLRRWTAGRPSR